jgi:hypothetical protein
MTVPKKRKKLAETAEGLKKTIPAQHKKKSGKVVRISTRNSAKKIDNAFEIMKHIDDDDFPADEALEKSDSIRKEKSDSSSSQSKRQGFRFQISLDALIPDKKSQDEDRKSTPIKKSPLLDIGVTIPFFWRFPIIGEIAQKVVRNIKTIKF